MNATRYLPPHWSSVDRPALRAVRHDAAHSAGLRGHPLDRPAGHPDVDRCPVLAGFGSPGDQEDREHQSVVVSRSAGFSP